MPSPYDSVRVRLEALVSGNDPDVRALAKALLSILALYEDDPYRSVPAQHIYGVLSRHLIKDEDVFDSIDYRTLWRRQPTPPDRPAVPPASPPDPLGGHRDHVIGEGSTHGDRLEDRGARTRNPAASRTRGDRGVSGKRNKG